MNVIVPESWKYGDVYMYQSGVEPCFEPSAVWILVTCPFQHITIIVDVLKAQVTFSLKDQEDLTCTKKASRRKKAVFDRRLTT